MTSTRVEGTNRSWAVHAYREQAFPDQPCAWVLFFKGTIYPHVIKQSGEIHFHCRFRGFEYPDVIVFKELHRGQAIPLARDLVAEQQPFLSSRCRVYNLP